MKLHYYSETDSLYIDLSERVAAETKELAEGVVGDFDDQGRLVGLDIDHASQVARLDHFELDALPLKKTA
jgi:uncharacterized protein YuzE